MDYKLLCQELFRLNYDSPAYKIGNALRDINSKEYHFIASCDYDIPIILEDLKKSKVNLADKSFIDIGAGTSIIPLIFKIAGCKESKGLEFDKVYVRLDNRQMLFEGNLLTHDFSEYDILYSYNPIRDEDLMVEGLENIIKTMKKEATLYFNVASSKVQDYLVDIKQAKKINPYSRIYKYKK